MTDEYIIVMMVIIAELELIGLLNNRWQFNISAVANIYKYWCLALKL